MKALPRFTRKGLHNSPEDAPDDGEQHRHHQQHEEAEERQDEQVVRQVGEEFCPLQHLSQNDSDHRRDEQLWDEKPC